MWFDPVLVERAVDLVSPWLAVVLALLSYLGSAVLITTLLLGWYSVRPSERLLSWIGVVFAAYVARAFLKGLNDIERPAAEPSVDPSVLPGPLELVYTHPVGIDTTGFPSGHMIAAIVFWGLLASGVTVSTERNRVLGATAIVLVVAVTRVFLGAHWIEDVVVGGLVGLGLLSVGLIGLSVTSRPVAFGFGLALGLGSLDLLIVGSLTAQAIFPVALGVFLGLSLARIGWIPAWSPISQPTDSVAVAGVIGGLVVLAVVVVVNPPGVPALFLLAPVAGMGMHWHPRPVIRRARNGLWASGDG